MRILLTGKNSFTGRTLLPMLEEEGHEVVCLVRAESGGEGLRWDFHSPLPAGPPAFDAVIHLAAHVSFAEKLELGCYRANTVSTMALAALAREQGSHFIFASTVSVHDRGSTHVNSATPVQPSSHYGMSKYLAEEALKSAGASCSILRLNGIYGLNGPGHLMLNQSITNALNAKKRPILKGAGKCRRNYICVNDVARWISHLASGSGRKNAPGSPFQEILYLAGPEVMSMEAYLAQIAAILLPGEDIERIEGPDGPDMIVEQTPFPFKPVKFGDYLRSLL